MDHFSGCASCKYCVANSTPSGESLIRKRNATVTADKTDKATYRTLVESGVSHKPSVNASAEMVARQVPAIDSVIVREPIDHTQSGVPTAVSANTIPANAPLPPIPTPQVLFPASNNPPPSIIVSTPSSVAGGESRKHIVAGTPTVVPENTTSINAGLATIPLHQGRVPASNRRLSSVSDSQPSILMLNTIPTNEIIPVAVVQIQKSASTNYGLGVEAISSQPPASNKVLLSFSDSQPSNPMPNTTPKSENVPVAVVQIQKSLSANSGPGVEVSSQTSLRANGGPSAKLVTSGVNTVRAADPSERQVTNYQVVVGRVYQFDRAWTLRYATVDLDDKYGGSFRLVGDNFGHLNDGQMVRVEGSVLPSDDRTTSPFYKVDRVEVIMANSE